MAKRSNAMSSKERIIATIKHEETDYIPLCFEGIGHPWVPFVNNLYPDKFERARFYLDIGVDFAINYSSPRLSSRGYTTKQWKEHPSNEEYPILFKEYITPKGNLRQIIRKHDYPSNHISVFSDHHVPSSRSIKYLIEKEEDLDKLEYILAIPNDEELAGYREEAKIVKKFCNDNQIIFAGYLDGIGDPLLWMSGIDKIVMSSVIDPDFLKRYVDIVAKWNKALLEIQIDAGVNLIIRRGWYESMDFWAPDLYREFLFNPLKEEIDLAHQAGVYFTYIMNSAIRPFIDIFKDLKFDILSNLDPMTAGMDLADIKREIGDYIALYGGVNNFLVIESGTEEEVKKAVAEAIEKLSPNGGYIMGPGDAVDFLFTNPETTKRNFFEMIRVWKELR